MQIVAIAYQVYEITRNPVSLGLIGLANLIPILLFSLFGGLIVDRMDRKKVLIVSHGAASFLALILFYITYTGLVNEWMIYGILVLVSTAQSFSLPARQAVLPHLVPQKYFMNAVSLNTLQHQAAMMIGPAIAGFVIAGFGVQSVYLINALSFLLFFIALRRVRVVLQTSEVVVAFHLDSVVDGVKFVLSTPILYQTMILDFIATFFGTANILMPIFAKEVLHVGPQGLGLLYSAPAVGGVVAGILVSAFHNRIVNQGRMILISVMIYGVATVGFGLSSYMPLALMFLFFVGLGDMVSTILRNTIRQMVTPDHLRGRMVSVMRIFFQGGPQLGEIEAGFLARAIGAPASVVIGGVGVVLTTALIAWKSKSLRRYKGRDAAV